MTRQTYSISRAITAKRAADPYKGFHLEKTLCWFATWIKAYIVRTNRKGLARKRATKAWM